MQIGQFPRKRLAHLPTPLEPMARLTELLGGPTLWIKRDDCTGLATGGNKTRKLEYLMAEAIAAGADTIVTPGAYQSNHVRQTAAAASLCGMTCEILLENRIKQADEDYRRSGNRFLNNLFRANIREYDGGTDMAAACQAVAEELRGQGKSPFVIPGGGSNPTGALGYVRCALETVDQANQMDLHIDTLVHATGSTGTQAGLVAGMHGSGAGTTILGISVSAPKEKQETKVHALVQATCDKLQIKAPPREVTMANSDYVGDGYGVPTPAMIEAIELTAQQEGILLDPVYSGKAMAGLIDLVRRGHWSKDQNVVFLHTGGAVGLFGYLNAFQ